MTTGNASAVRRLSIAMLKQCCNQSKPCRNNVATLQYWAKNRRCFLSLVTSPLACMLGFPNSDHVIYSPGILPFVFLHVHGTAFERNRSLGFYGGGGGGGGI